LERLEITRETVLELATEDCAPAPKPLPPGYREILALFEQAGDGLRAKDVCHALGLGTEPRHTEGMRAKLKRLVNRDILTEAEPACSPSPRWRRPPQRPIQAETRRTITEYPLRGQWPALRRVGTSSYSCVPG
jgi:hypothetical protein